MYEFVSLSEQIWRNVALRHLFTDEPIHRTFTDSLLYSEWVPSEWESKQLIKTNYPQVIIKAFYLHTVASG